MIPRIYADTSVLGGCEDEEFREPVPAAHVEGLALSREAEELAAAADAALYAEKLSRRNGAGNELVTPG